MLTSYQRQQLRQYSVYMQPAGPVLFHTGEWKEHLTVVQEIIQAPHRTAAASYLTRRLGMFVSMQFWNLTLYDEYWSGRPEDLNWIAVREYGYLAISAFCEEEEWRSLASDQSRQEVVAEIWKFARICIESLSSSKALQRIHWENVFGYIVWHYSIFMQQSDLREKALTDWLLLQHADSWVTDNPFEAFVQGRTPGELVRMPVRSTCCLAKDIPGQLTCGFCPLPN